MKQLLITTHLYTFAVICVIATTISSCTFKKKTDMETLTGTKENELTMLVGTYTSGDSKEFTVSVSTKKPERQPHLVKRK